MPTNHRIDDIQILRAIAILLVFFHHLPVNLIFWMRGLNHHHNLFINGHLGVDLFFAVSGFVIARSLLPKLRSAASTREFIGATLVFWIRRFWRLTPAAWFWLFLPMLLFFLFNDAGAFRSLKGNVSAMVSAFLHVANFHLLISHKNPDFSSIFFPYWTLSLEVQFYLLLPVIVFFSRHRLVAVLITLIVIQLIVDKPALGLLPIRTDALFLGVLLAIWQQHPSYLDCKPTFFCAWQVRTGFVLMLILSLMTIGAKIIVPKSHYHGLAALVCAVAVWVASYDKHYLIRFGWLKPVLLWVGSRSYSIYLSHAPAFAATREIFYRLNPAVPVNKQGDLMIYVFVASGIALAFICAEFSYRLLEQPLRDKGRNIAKAYEVKYRCRQVNESRNQQQRE